MAPENLNNKRCFSITFTVVSDYLFDNISKPLDSILINHCLQSTF